MQRPRPDAAAQRSPAGITPGTPPAPADQAVLVRNSMQEVCEEALTTVRRKGIAHRLYLARGGFLEMNGNYAAGVLEGLAHFVPEALRWIEDCCDQ